MYLIFYRCNYVEEILIDKCDHPQKENIETQWLQVRAKTIRENAKLQSRLLKKSNE